MDQHLLIQDLEHSRKKLDYYLQLKGKSPLISKWIEIYSTRVQRLEKQAKKLGLLNAATAQTGSTLH